MKHIFLNSRSMQKVCCFVWVWFLQHGNPEQCSANTWGRAAAAGRSVMPIAAQSVQQEGKIMILKW